MTSGGIVRRIDELGRIVIPKELRKTMRLKVGDEMEILSTAEGLTLKKFNAYEGFKNVASSVAKSLAGYVEADVIIVDSSQVVVAEGANKRNYFGAMVGGELLQAVDNRRSSVLHGDDLKGVFENVKCDCCYLVFEPIVSNGDSYGGMAILLCSLPSDVARAYLKFCTDLIVAMLQ
ncbi:MAG: AbrB/MazE/SpoVT family DNA-binding domain-containing protein [Clostridia bacterium]|nr:AbrB/MazE/SpoVT family DNA-binding domain-containing protein [Clostridia bacterium]